MIDLKTIIIRETHVWVFLSTRVFRRVMVLAGAWCSDANSVQGRSSFVHSLLCSAEMQNAPLLQKQHERFRTQSPSDHLNKPPSFRFECPPSVLPVFLSLRLWDRAGLPRSSGLSPDSTSHYLTNRSFRFRGLIITNSMYFGGVRGYRPSLFSWALQSRGRVLTPAHVTALQ